MPKDTKKKLEDQVEELEEKWKRAVADYRNLERRIEEQQGQFVKFSNATLLQKFLDVYDDLQRAAEHIQDEGLDMVIKRFDQALLSEGVEPIQTEDALFDPETMECIDTVAGEKEAVISVVKPGYMFHDMVLRPAQVTVGQGKESSKDTEEE